MKTDSPNPQDNAVLDHLVVAAQTLEQGSDYIGVLFGVPIQIGGRHLNQGTHNQLLSLGPSCYLEIIAIDPDGTAPDRPRWFGLDDPDLQRALAEQPRLITWVARCGDIGDRLARADIGAHEVRPMQRADLRWRMSFTPDGNLLEQGIIPPLIQWQSEPHPASRLTDVGCRLRSLSAAHTDPDRVKRLLLGLGLSQQIEVHGPRPESPPGLSAVIETPTGPRSIPGH